MRTRLSSRRLERLAEQLAPVSTEPRVCWIQVANPDPGRAFVDGALAAMRAAVWDELAPLATRGEVLASADLFDAASGRIEAAGHWWRLVVAEAATGAVATVVERGVRPWLARG